MAVVIVLEDGWDGHYVLSSACHQAGHRVLSVQHPSVLKSTLRATSADALVVDTAIPGVCLSGISDLAAEAGLPLIVTGCGMRAPAPGLSVFVPRPGSAPLVRSLCEALTAAAVPCAAA